MKEIALLVTFSLSLVSSWIVDPGPSVKATKGEVWPKPQYEQKSDNFYIITPLRFSFNIIAKNCLIVQEAAFRYENILSSFYKLTRRNKTRKSRKWLRTNSKFIGILNSLDINLQNDCGDNDYPSVNMDEAYNLTVPSTIEESAVLSANSVWGILRGLETFSQLVYLSQDRTDLFLNGTLIQDFPRFPHRGLLLDTSRHYLPVDIIYAHLDAMSYNKLNVFHWHIVDDQSFPYQSEIYPELSEKGAYDPLHKIYTIEDVKNILERARLRGIRVMPEFDTPGHTRSWGEGIPELLTRCFEKGVDRLSQFGPMNPSRQFLFSFIEDFFKEIKSRFPDPYLHLGGDEVPYDCWQSNPDVNNFMDSLNITGDYKALERFYMEKVLNITSRINKTSVVWEEVFLADTATPNDTVIQVWLGGYSLLEKVTETGRRALLSSCWYLDHLKNGGDWLKFYDCDPEDFGGTKEQLKLVLGGEACMWGEVVNRYNVLQRTWPRASATAEKLWSKYNADTHSAAAKRLEEHTCRMNIRDIPAQPPNGPGYCVV